MNRLLLFFLLIITSAYCYSSNTDDDFSSQSTTAVEDTSTNDVRWYQIELLIFKQRPIPNEINEIWPKDISLIYPDNWETLKTSDEYEALYQKRVFPNTPFILLDKKQFQFNGIKKKLLANRNGILFHGAWRQSLTQNLDQNATTLNTTILIHGGEKFDDHYELEGTVSLKLLRYLHIDTNLWLTRFVPAVQTPVVADTPADNPLTPDAETKVAIQPVTNWPELPSFPMLSTIPTAASNAIEDNATEVAPTTPKQYQVDEIVLNKQSRRMRSYETHYIDHPKFGILVRFTPLDTNTMLPIPPKN